MILSATEFRRSSEFYIRANGDVAHVLGCHDGNVLFNVEGRDGGRYKHRFANKHDFAARWIGA